MVQVPALYQLLIPPWLYPGVLGYYFHKLISNSNVLSIDSHVLWGGHGHQKDRLLCSKGFVDPCENFIPTLQLKTRFLLSNQVHLKIK